MNKKHLTTTQSLIYKYIVEHKQAVKDYSLRQLAAKLNVAPASVVRTVNKLGYKHYSELCAQLDVELREQKTVDDLTYQAQTFFQQIDNQHYDEQIEKFKKLILPETNFVFFGVGTSGDLADYGARQFVNHGRYAFSITDPFYPIQLGRSAYKNCVVIVLSVSGETEQAIEQVMSFNDQGATVVSITNEAHNSIAGMSDLNFSYHLQPRVIGQTINLTSQIAVIYLLERLSRAV